MEKRAELVFIPTPLVGHLVSTVEIAKLLLHRHPPLSITFIIIHVPFPDPEANAYIDSLAAAPFAGRLGFVDILPPPVAAAETVVEKPAPFSPGSFAAFLQHQKARVRDAATRLIESHSESDSAGLAGFVIDMFCTPLMDVAYELGVPSYLFYTSGACALGLLLGLQALHDEHGQDLIELKDSKAELAISCFVNPVPAGAVPSTAVEKANGASTGFLNRARRFRKTKGILVNTFMELESHALESILQDGNIPPVYPVGPILNLQQQQEAGPAGIMTWLDEQPPLSVVFLCFGSMGSFGPDQVKEIARALERSGYRFLWSLRRPPSKEIGAMISEYVDLQEVLPEGFLDRTIHTGKVIGWAPQVAILSHPAIGGFVSHCGWNSTLESVWCGVPIATWPMYAEQQINAFQMVKELGLSVEISLDYRKNVGEDANCLISAEDIERGVRRVMESESEIRRKVKEMKQKCQRTLVEGGTSYLWLGRFIEDVMGNIRNEITKIEREREREDK
ncbi:anthocyanidin 3-O-glucosyltransferase 2-like [Malania oleifera]|uniref:anthocyanidin 3-O-glucosyltransferase 2-like n=1 Tax=Malania oleifera TaxID=397392 RepID=UPI0025AEB276|nr:anthocyanidin 3-O-glucosyltransferase 2-like [Malania oleifera]